MSTYIVTEKQNTNSTRAGERIEAQTLPQAKRKATQMKMFQGTVLTIENEAGALLSVKKDGKWEDRIV